MSTDMLSQDDGQEHPLEGIINLEGYVLEGDLYDELNIPPTVPISDIIPIPPIPSIIREDGQEYFIVESSYNNAYWVETLASFGIRPMVRYERAQKGQDGYTYGAVYVLDFKELSDAERNFLKTAAKVIFKEPQNIILWNAPIPAGAVFTYYDDHVLTKIRDLIVASDLQRLYVAAGTNTVSKELARISRKSQDRQRFIPCRKSKQKKEINEANWEKFARWSPIIARLLTLKEISAVEAVGLTTHLVWLTGGGVRLTKWFTNNFSLLDSYSSIPAYVNRMGYSPYPVEEVSAHLTDQKYDDLRNVIALPQGEVIVHQEPEFKEIGEIRDDLEKVFPDFVTLSPDNKTHILKAPTGVGKTTLLKQIKKGIIAVETHEQKDNLAKANPSWVKQPEAPKFDDESLNHYLKGLLETGNTIIYMNTLGKIAQGKVVSHAATGGSVGLFILPQIFKYSDEESKAVRDFLAKHDEVINSDKVLVCTHHHAIYIRKNKYRQGQRIYFDEDPMLVVLYRMDKIKISQLADLSVGVANETDGPAIAALEKEIREAAAGQVHSVPYFDIENRTRLSYKISTLGDVGPALKLISASWFFKERADSKLIHFAVVENPVILENSVILSATIDIDLYKLALGEQIGEALDLGYVVRQGKLIQDTSRMFSREDLKNAATRKYIETLSGTRPVLTFLSMTKKFKHGFEGIHSGKSRASNKLEGKEIAVACTPNAHPSTYFLLATCLGLSLNGERLIPGWQRVKHRGMEFIYYTYEGETLQRIHFFYTETDLLQLVGRARLEQHPEASVLVFSAFPIFGAEFLRRPRWD